MCETVERLMKTIEDSKLNTLEVVMPKDVNTSNRLFGGVLMSWIDIIAGLTAYKHTGVICTTASVDYISFEQPIYMGQTVRLESRLTYVGNSSMEIRVDSYIEQYTKNDRIHVSKAYLTYVSIDETGKPILAPRLQLKTEEEQLEWNSGLERAKYNKQRRTEH